MKFVKKILTSGTYHVNAPMRDAKTGEVTMVRKERTFTPEDLKDYADNTNKMLAEGLRVPAPIFKHDLNANPNAKDDELKGNAGFWSNFHVGKDEYGKDGLFGILEATEEYSPKIGTEVRDTSIYSVNTDNPEHQFMDGLGRKWNKVLMHVALPLQPIEPGQSNFIPLGTAMGSELLDFGESIMGNTKPTPITQVLTLLSKVGIVLPSDTTDASFMDRLVSALTQKANGGSSSSLSEKPDDSKTEVLPIMMSLTQQQVEAIVSSNVVDPATGKPFTLETFAESKSAKEASLENALTVMGHALKSNYQAAYKSRIDAGITKGQITKEYADTELYPLLDSIQMSVNGEGVIANSNGLETILKAVENLPAKQDTKGQSLMGHQAPSGSVIIPTMLNAGTMTDDRAKEIVNLILSQ